MEHLKYLIFAGKDYYPQGGFLDYIGSACNSIIAREQVENLQDEYDWAHIVHPETLKIVVVGRVSSVFNYETEDFTYRWEWTWT